MDKMREEFEVWCCERGFTLKPAETNCGVLIDGEYGHPRVQLAWESWKASREALEVELADAMIRILDLAGAYQLDLGGALVEKLVYNTQRADHKREARAADDGKKF